AVLRCFLGLARQHHRVVIKHSEHPFVLTYAFVNHSLAGAASLQGLNFLQKRQNASECCNDAMHQ
ncbi:MAG: hypothetical protein WCC39_17330, partial [Telluria sp.]